MTCGSCCGVSTITPRVASAAMAMVTARTEEDSDIVGFAYQLVNMGINSTMKLTDVIKEIEKVRLGQIKIDIGGSGYIGKI